MDRVRFRGVDSVRTIFWDRNVDPGPCFTCYLVQVVCLKWEVAERPGEVGVLYKK